MKMTIRFVCILNLILILNLKLFAQEARVVDQTLARVNRDLITQSMLTKAEQGLRHELEQQLPNDKAQQDIEFEKLSKHLLTSLIDDKLIAQKAEEMGINVEAEVNQTILELCKQNNLASLSDCQTVMEKQGINIEEIKSNFRIQFLRRTVLGQEVYGPTLEKIPEREKREYYDKHIEEISSPGEEILSEIFIGFAVGTKAQIEAENKIQQAIQELKSGAEFSIVVKKYSDDTRQSKATNGLMPPFKTGDLADDLKKEVDKLQPGQVSSLIKSKNGFQILKLESRKLPKPKEFEEVSGEIAYKLASEKSGNKVKEYLKGLRGKAFIRLNDAYKNTLSNDEL